MPYTDIGFDEFLQRSEPATGSNSGSSEQLDPTQAESFLPEISGSKVMGGVMTSPDGRLKIDLDNGVIKVNNGVADLLQFGVLEDGEVGLMMKDNDENILLNLSSKNMLFQSSSKEMSIDLILAQLILRENGVPIFLLGRQDNGF